jgi:hypothetical protein
MVTVSNGIYTGVGNRDINFRGKAITVKSKNGPANCIIDCENIARAFIFDSYEENDSILDGFTIRNGYTSEYGGGIYIHNSSPTIMSCKVMDCQTDGLFGGGIYCEYGSPYINNCEISNNSSNMNGGGIYCTLSAAAIIENCTILNNFAPGTPGTNTGGGGIACGIDDGYSATIRNCLIAGNSTNRYGGGIYLTSSNTRIYNCTIVGNSANAGGAVYFICAGRTPVLENCISWDNSTDQIYTYYDGPIIKYNNIAGGWLGQGNINTAPLFVDAVGGNYRLRLESPCIDAGDPNYVIGSGEADMDGSVRLADGDCDGTVTVDMGTYEGPAWVYSGDFAGGCDVDMLDLAVLAENWLSNNAALDIAPYLEPDGVIDLKEFAVLAENWLMGDQ